MKQYFKLPKKDVKEFQRMYLMEFGEDLDETTAKAHAKAFLKLFWSIFSMRDQGAN